MNYDDSKSGNLFWLLCAFGYFIIPRIVEVSCAPLRFAYCSLHLLDNLMADLLPDENNLKYIVGEQHYVIQAVIALREKFLFSGKKNPPLKMNECNFLHHYKWNGGNLYFQFNFLKSQNIYLNFNISQKYPSFLTYFWKVGLGLGCIWQQFCQSDPEYIRFACNAKFICSGTPEQAACSYPSIYPYP